MSDANDITRREALSRTALLLGGTLALPHVAALEGLEGYIVPAPGSSWRARTLSEAQLELVANIAEHIIPTTTTPGARAAGVHEFVDTILTDYYAAAERGRFLAGLADVDQRAQQAHGSAFLKSGTAQQLAVLTAMDREAYPPPRVLARTEPMNDERRKMQDSLARQGSTGAAVGVGGSLAPRAGPEVATGWFFRRMKELTLLGYYTSEVGATQELKVNPMGVYRGDIPYRSIGHSWA